MGSGVDGIRYDGLGGLEAQPQRPVPQLGWQALDPELQLARQRLQLERSPRPSPKLASFFPGPAGVFLFYTLDPAAEHLADLV